MTERRHEKTGHMRVTVDLEINDELMDALKDTMSKASIHLPELLKRGGTEKTNCKETC
ncbi:MAG: hypothetical protein LBH74_09250 [Nitrososphaerota archaeon]|jgi:hypothetical protein|uniref:hypothetical protein n=1 Tax=Candidatus Bathycorpusculum sp. TaxID=2994959 RepID=UPI00282F5FD2|nr:hypothetical protein [Candidatus Termitimicrobium sp.]MCL2431329.1 hypothetical protein [Candidatus Termitimicrobium sp.]MDR0493804.1 hypothetical protein [Nitrososphaerota archaeon]